MSSDAKKPKIDQETAGETEAGFSSPWHFSDVVLVVEERKFHVHRAVLSMWSPVFERMFLSEFKEKSSLEIPLPGKVASEMEALLKLIYFRSETVNEKHFESLLKLADEYQMKEVTNLCVDFMVSILKRETALHLYVLANQYNLKDLMTKCIEQIKLLPIELVKMHEHFLELSAEKKFDLIFQKLTASENVLCTGNTGLKDKIFENFKKKDTLQSCKKCQSSVKSGLVAIQGLDGQTYVIVWQ